MKRLIKIMICLGLAVFAFILVAGFLTQTAFFRSWIKRIALSRVNELIEAKLSIAEISGTLFTEIELHNLCLLQESDTLLQIPELRLSYNLFALLYDTIEVNQLYIRNPAVRLSEDSSGVWNIGRLMGTPVPVDSASKEEGKSFAYAIILRGFALSDGLINIQSKNNLIPAQLSELHVALNGLYSANRTELNLDSLAFQAEQPDLILNQLSFHFNQDQEKLSVQDLILRTGRNEIHAEGDYQPEDTSDLVFDGRSVDLGEFEFILPDLTLNKNPDLEFSSRISKDSLEFNLLIDSEDESLYIKGTSSNYTALLDSSQSDKMMFSLDLNINNIRPQRWLTYLPAAKLNGNLKINGSLRAPDDLEARLTGRLYNIESLGFRTALAQFEADYQQGNLTGKFYLNSELAVVNLDLSVESMLNWPVYEGHLTVERLDLAYLFPRDSIHSDLRFVTHVCGEGWGTATRKAALDLTFSPSRIIDIPIDSLHLLARLDGDDYRIDEVSVKVDAGKLILAGEGSLAGIQRFNYRFDINQLQGLGRLVGADSIDARGFLTGNFEGDLQNFTNKFSFNLKQIAYNEIKVDYLAGTAALMRVAGLFNASSDISSKKIRLGNRLIDNLTLTTDYQNGELFTDLAVQFDPNLSASLTAMIIPDSLLTLSVPRLELNFLDEHWQGGLEQLIYNPATNDLDLKELKLLCSTDEEQRSIFAGGQLSFKGEQAFTLKIKRLNSKKISAYFSEANELDGQLSFELDLRGTLDSPVFMGNLSLDKGSVGLINYEAIRSDFNYQNDYLDFHFDLNFNGSDSLIAAGKLPVHLSLTDTVKVFDPDQPLNLSIRSEAIPIALFLTKFLKLPEISGTFLCDITLKNTFKAPKIDGNLQIKNGLLRSPYWGIDYQNIDLVLTARDETFTLEKFHIGRDKGSVNMEGKIQLDYSKKTDRVRYSDIRLQAKDFFLVQHKDFETQLSADIHYRMDGKEPKITGSLQVDRSNFYLPTVLKRAGFVTEGGAEVKPLLVSAREATKEKQDPEKTNSLVKTAPDSLKLPGFIEIIEGDLEIRLPRNTWIRNPQLRMELGGDINVRMTGGEVYLKGPIKIIRGQYDLLGRRFTVLDGNIDFQGKNEINPLLLLEAEYIYRTSGREKKALVLKITGTLKTPAITFFESNNQISQEDALSIVLYGRKKDELSFGSQSDIAQSEGTNLAAMGIVSNILSDRLSRSVGENLKLDVIEVNAQDNWQSANFVVGKYITEDIFLTYTREFGQNQDNNLYPETISMEYEIRKNLFFQLIQGDPRISGLDILFKFDWD